MASFTFTSPDGKSYTVMGPEGSTPEQAFGMLQQHLNNNIQTAGQNAGAAVHAGVQPPQANVPGMSIGDVGAGERDIAATALGSAPHQLASGLEYLGRLLFTRTDPNKQTLAPHVPQPQLGEAGQQLLSAIGSTPGLSDAADVVKNADAWLQQNAPTLHKALHGGLDTAGAISNVAAPLQAGKSILSGIGSLAKETPMAASTAAAVEPRSPNPAAAPAFRSAQDASGLATSVAGPAGLDALNLQNNKLAVIKAATEAGVPTDMDLTPQNVKDAAKIPAAVYDRAGQRLPTAPLSPQAQEMAAVAAGGDGTVNTGGKDITDQIQSIYKQLTAGPMEGPTVIKNMQKLRQEGFAGVNAEQDVDANTLGKAKLGMADALEQHIADTLPPGSDVSLDQLVGARTALAKNYAVQEALRGTNQLDPQAFVRMAQNGAPLSGGLADIAQFAADHPRVLSKPSATLREVGPPGLTDEVLNFDLQHPLKSVARIFGGRAGKNALLGPSDQILQNAKEPGVAGFGDKFAPLPPGSPMQAPPGTAFTPHQPQLATPNPQRDFFGFGTGGMTAETPSAPAPSQKPFTDLANVMSQGVEKEPPLGLSLAPDYSPSQGGIPFRVDPGHMAGDLQLADALTGGRPENLSDVAAVRSQGVPEGTMQRAPQKFKQNKRDRVELTLADRLGGPL